MIELVQGYIFGLREGTKWNFLRPEVLFEVFHNNATAKLSISIELKFSTTQQVTLPVLKNRTAQEEQAWGEAVCQGEHLGEDAPESY